MLRLISWTKICDEFKKEFKEIREQKKAHLDSCKNLRVDGISFAWTDILILDAVLCQAESGNIFEVKRSRKFNQHTILKKSVENIVQVAGLQYLDPPLEGMFLFSIKEKWKSFARFRTFTQKIKCRNSVAQRKLELFNETNCSTRMSFLRMDDMLNAYVRCVWSATKNTPIPKSIDSTNDPANSSYMQGELTEVHADQR